ncbi:MAG: DUF115 domain-containing protein [Treponema sp.]|nr:DUF115 domain-containing protein [Treponema sp.]
MNTNLDLFRQRFPGLYEISKADSSQEFITTPAKNGEYTASFKGNWLHSRYNPSGEALKLIQDFDEDKYESALFLGSGLLYAPELLAEKAPDSQIIIVESDPSAFYAALACRSLEKLFKHPKLALILTKDSEEAASALKNFSAGGMKVYSFPSLTASNKNWYEAIKLSVEKSAEREKVNVKTLERFSSLWLKNSCKNLRKSFTLDGINKFKDMAGDIPFTIIAAGPSLEKILPYMEEIKKRSIIVCVDTALHALLAKNVEPDFIVLVDPQYVCALHLEFLKAPSSILIAESAVYPSVLRFECKERVLCSSNFPMGKYFESYLGEKGRLGAGGSVATVAWDFARFCGAKRIYIAAMDLGFPGKQTHIKGSQFEEKAHVNSIRTNTAETFSTGYLMSAPLKKALNYENKEILTDLRMTIFSSWFEASCSNALIKGQKTYSLTSDSLAIKGIEKSGLDQFLNEGLLDNKGKDSRNDFFARAEKEKARLKEEEAKKEGPDFDQVLKLFLSQLNFLTCNADEGLKICRNAVNDLKKKKSVNTPVLFNKLEDIDKKILTSSAKNAAALVFPTKDQLDKLTVGLSQDKVICQFEYSGIVYKSIKEACSSYIELLAGC